jgi:KRAB domain-containing zinc finger protein
MSADCGKHYNSKLELKRHVEIDHFHLGYIRCPVCLRSFATMKNLKEHYSVHEDARRFTCEQCGKKFRERIYMVLHKQKHLLEWTRVASSKRENGGPK